jgi:GAF domain-containing protein
VETKSEIVVPVRVNEEIIGEIDVDSHTRGAFGPKDREFLERCAAIIGGFIEVHRN